LYRSKKLPKAEFRKIIGNVWTEVSADILKESFKKGGIIPYNKNCVSEDTIDPTALKKWKAKCAQDYYNSNNKEKNNELDNLPLLIDQPSTSTVSLNESSSDSTLQLHQP